MKLNPKQANLLRKIYQTKDITVPAVRAADTGHAAREWAGLPHRGVRVTQAGVVVVVAVADPVPAVVQRRAFSLGGRRRRR